MIRFSLNKKTIFLVLATSATLLLGACSDKETAQVEPAPADTTTTVDTTTVETAPVELQTNDDVAVATADDTSAPVVNDDVAIATTDDTTIVDGTETQENISTN